MVRCTPFLLFDGRCAEAMSFYHSCTGGELLLTKVGDTPMKAQFPPEKHDRMIYAHLRNAGFEISGADWMASPEFDPLLGNMSAIYVTGSSYDDLKPVFDKLGQGAERERFQELRAMPFGIYGQFYDKFGVQWIFRGEAAR